MNLQKDSNKDSGETSKVVKIQQKKEKRSSKHCCQAYIVSGLYFYTYFNIVVEISKNFKEFNMYQKIMKIIIMYQTIGLIHKY